MICLSTGAVVDAAIGPFQGKGHSEHGLLREIQGALCAGDVLLADALYCSYWLITSLQAEGIDVLFEQHGSRITDFRRGRRLGVRDHVVSWKKPARPSWMTHEQYAASPDELTVRELKTDGRVLVTTMPDPRKTRKKDLSDLYMRRWHVELDFRNIKTTLGMDVLRCITPQMVEKELWVNLLAYNLIRLLMAQAAVESGLRPRQLSFKHTVQIWTRWTLLNTGRNQDWQSDIHQPAAGLLCCQDHQDVAQARRLVLDRHAEPGRFSRCQPQDAQHDGVVVVPGDAQRGSALGQP